MTDTATALRSFTLLDATGAKHIAPNVRRRLEAITGEVLTFRPDSPQASQDPERAAFLCEVVSAPAGSSAAFSGTSLTCDVPGVYRVRLTNGQQAPVQQDIVAFRPEALDWPPIADMSPTPEIRRRGHYPTSPTARRFLLQVIANGGAGRKAADSEFAATTTANPVPQGQDVSTYHTGKSCW
jgi:hypothetical protein